MTASMIQRDDAKGGDVLVVEQVVFMEAISLFEAGISRRSFRREADRAGTIMREVLYYFSFRY